METKPTSIVLRSYNEGWALRDTLAALQAQAAKNWELIVIDSGSTDGSVDLIRRAQPRHFIRILPQDYKPGRVLNLGMELARSDQVIGVRNQRLHRVPRRAVTPSRRDLQQSAGTGMERGELRIQVASPLARRADVREQQTPEVFVPRSCRVQAHRRNAQPLLVDLAREGHRSRRRSPHVAVVRARGDVAEEGA